MPVQRDPHPSAWLEDVSFSTLGLLLKETLVHLQYLVIIAEQK